jgi:hypothetical protein
MTWDTYQNQGQRQSGSDEPYLYSGYGAPRSQNPYTIPPQYATPPYQQGGYSHVPPQQAPRPLEQSLRELPYQYMKVVTKPSAQSFAEETGKANWTIVWVQLLALAVFATILGLIRGAIGLISHSFVNTFGSSASSYIAITVLNGPQQLLIASASTFTFIVLPMSFFILVGIQYLIAKGFLGQGNFLAQSYATLLYQVPIYAASYVVGLIPIVGAIAGTALYIYGIVLNINVIMAVHRLHGVWATIVVLIPIAMAILLVILYVIVVVALFSPMPH